MTNLKKQKNAEEEQSPDSKGHPIQTQPKAEENIDDQKQQQQQLQQQRLPRFVTSHEIFKTASLSGFTQAGGGKGYSNVQQPQGNPDDVSVIFQIEDQEVVSRFDAYFIQPKGGVGSLGALGGYIMQLGKEKNQLRIDFKCPPFRDVEHVAFSAFEDALATVKEQDKSLNDKTGMDLSLETLELNREDFEHEQALEKAEKDKKRAEETGVAFETIENPDALLGEKDDADELDEDGNQDDLGDDDENEEIENDAGTEDPEDEDEDEGDPTEVEEETEKSKSKSRFGRFFKRSLTSKPTGDIDTECNADESDTTGTGTDKSNEESIDKGKKGGFNFFSKNRKSQDDTGDL